MTPTSWSWSARRLPRVWREDPVMSSWDCVLPTLTGGIPFSADKAATRAKEAEKLGSVIDGERGLLRAATRRAIESVALGSWMIQKEYPPRKVVQVFAGKEVHTLQFRRPLFSIFSQIWKTIGSEGYVARMDRATIEEVLVVGCVQPLKFTNLKAELNDVVTASDACETGGGTVYANRLSLKGLTEVVALEEGIEGINGTITDWPGWGDSSLRFLCRDWWPIPGYGTCQGEGGEFGGDWNRRWLSKASPSEVAGLPLHQWHKEPDEEGDDEVGEENTGGDRHRGRRWKSLPGTIEALFHEGAFGRPPVSPLLWFVREAEMGPGDWSGARCMDHPILRKRDWRPGGCWGDVAWTSDGSHRGMC